MNPAQFNESFGTVAPCKLWKLGIEKGDVPVHINLIDMGHEIFQPFSKPHSGDFAAARFNQYFLVKDSQESNVLARFSNNHPALFEKTTGNGKSILFVSSLDLEWNNLCIKSIFVPFVHQLARRLCSKKDSTGARNLTVDDDITYHLAEDAQSTELRAPSGKTVDLKVHESDSFKMVNFQPEEPGIYELDFKKGIAKFAVNFNPKEPDLRPLDIKLFKSSVMPDKELEGERAAGLGNVAAGSSAYERVEEHQKLWRHLILFVLVLVGIEMYFAARIRRA